MSVPATDDAVLPTDVSVPSNISSDDSASQVLLKEDASLLDASAEAHDTAHHHLHSVPNVYNEAKPEHESNVASTPQLESGPTTLDSLTAENDLDAAVAHVSVPTKETDKTTTNGSDVDATTAEHPEPLTSESVMAIADTAEESGADKSIGHDSGIEILAPALEKKEDEERDHVPADKLDIEMAQIAAVVESDAPTSVEDTPEDMNHTQVEATKATMATEDNATEQDKVDVVAEDQPQVDVASEEPAAETNGSEGERKTVGGVEVEQETVHEAEPAAAVINNVEDNTHEATLDQHQPAQDVPQTAPQANGHEATVESEEPDVAVHVQEASSIAEFPADHVDVDDAAEAPEASTNHGVAAVPASVELTSEEVVTGVVSEEVPTPIEAKPVAEVPNAEVQSTEAASEEVPAVVEVEAVGEESIPPATVDDAAGKELPEVEQIQAPVDAAVAESVAEEVPTHAGIEIIVEAASEGVSAPVACDGVADPVEAEHAVEVPVEAEPATEVLGESSAVVEAEVAKSEEAAAPEAAIEVVPAHIEDKPAVEAIEAATSTKVATEQVPAPVETAEVLNEEALGAVAAEHVVSEETPAPAEAEAATEAIEATTSDEVADEVPVGDEPVAEEPVRSKPVGEEAKTTSKATDEDILVPVGAEPTVFAASEAPTTVHEETTPVQEKETVDVEPLVENALLVSDAEPKVSVQAVLKDREAPKSQAGIRDDAEAEVVSKPASVALATCAVEETAAEKQPDSAPAEYLSADVSEHKQPTEVVKDNDTGEVEPLTELTTEPLSILTSVDTTPFTPIVDSGIELKEQESQPPNLLSIVEEIERPKSPWSPSFQVISVGQGNSLEDAGVGLFQDNPTTSESNDAIKILAAPVLIIEDATGASAATVSENLSSTNEQSLEPPARPWTPSYSVHLQGSPVQVTKELTEDAPPLDEQHVDEVTPEQVHGSTVEDNEAASEQLAEVVVTQQETGEVSVSGSELEDVALTNTTEPQEGHLTSDAPESSAKLWMPSYSVHAQGSPPPKELESGAVTGAESMVLAESVMPTTAVEGLSNAEADSLTSVAPTVDIENKKLVDEANTTTGQETADDTTLEVSGVHAQGTPVVKSAELEGPTSVVDVEPFGVATSNGSASLEPELPVLSVSTESSENTTPEVPEEPWTPSYSVHSQGSPLTPRTELDGAYADAEAQVVEPPAETWTPSYSVHLQGPSMVVAKGLDESPEPPSLEPPAESRTPSYSARSQGTPLVTPKELEDIPVNDVVEFEASVETEAQQITPVSSLVLQADSDAVESHAQNDDTAVPPTDAEAEAILPAIVLVAPVISPASLDAAAENPVAGSEAEGPWTPSYSVHSQGSPSLDPVTLKDEQPSDDHSHTDETEVHNTQQQVSESPAAAEAVVKLNGTSEEVKSDDQAAPAWVPSYSISVQGTGVDKTETEAPSGSTAHSDVEHSVPVEIDAMTSVDKTIPALLVSEAMSSNAVPELHWTPSYSVTQQGSELPAEEGRKLDKLDSSSQPIPEASSVPDDTEPQLNEVQQSNESDTVQLRPVQAVGRAGDMAQNEKFMLFGLRAIVAYLWVLPKWLSMTRSPSESGHSRREASSSSSSSSSKFFPGGWFSTKPNEGRTSLDTAQGEFAASPKTTSDAFETISAETMYREAGVSASTTTVEDGINGQNRRWCIVM